MSGTGDPKDHADKPTAENINVNTQTVNVGHSKVSWVQVVAGLAAAATLIAFGVLLVELLDNNTRQTPDVTADFPTTVTAGDNLAGEAAAPSAASTGDSSIPSTTESSFSARGSVEDHVDVEPNEMSTGLKNLLDDTLEEDDKIPCKPIHLIDAWPIEGQEDTGLNLDCGQIRLIRADRNDEKVVLKRLHEDVSSIDINPALDDQVLALAYIAPNADSENVNRRPGGWFRVDGGPDGLWLGQNDREDVVLYPDDGSPEVNLRSSDYENQIEIIRLFLTEGLSSRPGSLIMVSAGSSLQEPKIQIHIGE